MVLEEAFKSNVTFVCKSLLTPLDHKSHRIPCNLWIWRSDPYMYGKKNKNTQHLHRLFFKIKATSWYDWLQRDLTAALLFFTRPPESVTCKHEQQRPPVVSRKQTEQTYSVQYSILDNWVWDSVFTFLESDAQYYIIVLNLTITEIKYKILVWENLFNYLIKYK